MRFGDINLFAIDVMTEPGLQVPSAVWGRMRVWCQGVPLGDFAEEHCGLYDAYSSFQELRTRLPSLWRSEFDGLDDLALCDWLDALLYSYQGEQELEDDRTLEALRRDSNIYSDYNFLTNWGEQFDRDGKSFIFCKPDGMVHVLKVALRTEHPFALQAPLAVVLAVIDHYLAWFESETARLAGKHIH